MTTQTINQQQFTLNSEVEKILAAFSEADREMLTDKLCDVLQTSSVLKILDENQPGGAGSLLDVLNVCRELGKVDTSLAWVVGVANSAWSLRSCFETLKAPILAMERNKIMAMVLGKPGTLKQDPETSVYRLSGEWRYASGWRYGSFFFCIAAVEGEGAAGLRAVAVPAEQFTIADQWRATGLRATQSVTIRAEEVEIPEEYMIDFTRILSGAHRAERQTSDTKNRSSYSGLFTGVLMNCLLGSILGATQAALEYVVASVDKRPVSGSSYAKMSESGAVRAALGRLHGDLDMCIRAAEYNASVVDEAARNPNAQLSTQDRVDNRLRATRIMRGCVDIVQELLWVYGSSGLDKHSPLERMWRDINTGARHGGFAKYVPEEAAGMSIIGQDPKTLTKMF